MKETLRHKEAFEYYLGLGEKRNITQVARKFTVSRASVSKWSREFSWQKRLKEREAKIGAKVEESTDNTIAEFKARLLNEWRAAEARWSEKFDAEEIEPKDYKDLETATKNILLLLGEPTERGEVNIDVAEKLAARIDDIAERRRSQGSDSGAEA